MLSIKNKRTTETTEKKAGKHAGKTKKTAKPKTVFVRTFAIALCVFLTAGISAGLGLHKASEWNPFDGTETLEGNEEMLSVLVTGDSPFFDAFTNSDRVNVLLLGINPPLADTIMLVSFDQTAQHVDIISIPRDTYYHRDGYYGAAEDKLNASYKGNAVNTAVAVSSILLGLPINYYAVIDYDGVKNIVDSMGGVPINVTMKGGMHYSDPYDHPPLVIDIPEGEQVLDGEHAVQFLRYRKGYKTGDIGREEAQQEFMKSAFKQCLSFELPKIARTVFQNVDSDITLGAAMQIATKAVGISPDSIATYTLPVQLQSYPPYYVFPKSEEIADMLSEIYMIGENYAAEQEALEQQENGENGEDGENGENNE